VADDDLYQDLPETPTQPQWGTPAPAGEELPDRLRVHSLARVLGTTSRRVLDALSELDGRTRSAHSSVDRTDAVRVRDVLAASVDTDAVEDSPAAAAAEPAEPVAEQAEPAQVVEPAAEPAAQVVEPAAEPAAQVVEPAEAGSQLIVETTKFEESVYMPLFVAPQPVAAGTGGNEIEDGEEDDEEDDESDGADTDGDLAERPANRRRRRGRRGRGRGRGEQGGADGEDESTQSEETSATGSEAEGGEAEGDDEESASGEGANRRRRRRRRRKGGGGDDGDTGSVDDPPNTVVHERNPRADKADRDATEIQGISGSTRLEAKRQRRRDGRDAGRRRPPILSEAEFLARREAVERVMVVRDKVRTEPPHEGACYTQIAVMEDGVVVEHFVTSAASASLVGNIYLGIVQNVLPSMEAAFVDIGRGRNGVLYAGEVNWEAAGLGGANRKIEQALSPGDYVVVQVSKDPVGHKGARLTTQVSLAGRYLVYVPGASSTGISRKLPDTERQRLKEILREVVPSDAGVIIRTASEGVKEDDIRADVNRLQERWTKIAEQAEEVKGKAAGAAVTLYEEPDVLVKVIRDLFNEDFSGLIVSGGHAWDTINSYISSVAPELLSKLTRYDPPGGPNGPDVFAVHRIDEQLAKAMDRKVWLPSGGTLVIDRTEAMTVIDVNTGKFTGAGGNLEQTVTKNNLEAAEEIVRQLRLRDIGGIVVIDFIDMVLESNRDLVLRRLTEALARDRTRHQVSEVTSLGLVQLTRKRLGTGLVEAFSTSCPHCSGRGIVLHADPVDTAAAVGRKSESGGRRGKRGKKSRAEEPAAARVPAHAPGEHPMFKAMAAANGKPEDEDSEEELADEFEREETAEQDSETAEQVTEETAAEDLADDDESDEDESDEDEIDVDLDEDDEDLDDEEGLDLDEDADSEDSEESADSGDRDVSGEAEAEVEPTSEVIEPAVIPAPAVATRRPRRRAAGRPAGPPSHDD